MPPYRQRPGEAPQFRTVNYNLSRGGLLMPPGRPGRLDTSTMLSQSPMSPTSSVGPDFVQDSFPFLEVAPPQPEDPSQSLMGISPRLADDNNIGDIGDLPFDAALGTDEIFGTSPFGQLPLGAPQTDVPSRLYEKLHNELEQVGTTVQAIASHPGLPQLYDVKDLLKSRFSSFETTIQARIECDEQPGFSCKFKDRYLCKLCQYGHRKVYKSRGTFKRHVSEGHHPRYQFRCPSSCGWTSFRRDKVHDHFRNTHRHSGRLRRDQINRIEKRVPPPMICELCWKSVDGWDDYFKCISEHCRLREDDSATTSASQSRRSSGDSGSGANDGGGNFNGGGLFGGSQNLFPYGGGNGHMSGGSFNSNNDQHYYSQASSFSEMDSASLSQHSLPGAASSQSEKRTSFLKQTFHHSYFKQPSKVESIIREPEITPAHRPSLQSRTRESSLSSTRADSDVQSPSKIPSHPSLQSADGPVRENHLAELFRRHLQEPKSPESDTLDNKECQNCGHFMNDCTSCHSQQLSVEKCHICMNGTGQKVSRKQYQLPETGFHEVTAGPATDGTNPEDSAVQASQATESSGSVKKPSSPSRNEAISSHDTSLKEAMCPIVTTMSMDNHNCSQTDPSKTSVSSPPGSLLSMMLIPKHRAPPSHEPLPIGLNGIQKQQQKSPPVVRFWPYPTLFAPKTPGSLHHGLGLYGYQRPKFNLEPSSSAEKWIPHLAPPGECSKYRIGIYLSTELTPSIRHGRAKLSRSCETHSHCSQKRLQYYQIPTLEQVEPQEDLQNRATESLDLPTQSPLALNPRLKRLDHHLRSNRSVPSKHVLSRKRYNALRTKLQVIAEIVALRRSSKAPILDPDESNVSLLKSLIPSGGCLKSPILDFNFSLLDIQSSLPLLLETMSLLQTDPKGNTSTKLTDYIYDSDDEMHLMLMILIPLLKKLLWMPTLPVEVVVAAFATIEV